MSYPGAYSTNDPDRPAVIMARDGQVRTFGELEARSCQFSQLMWAAGLRPGDHVAIFADNNIGYFDAYWAAMRSGLYFTTVNRYLTAEEAAYVVNDCGARVLVASPAVVEPATEMLPLIGDCDVRLMLDEAAEGFDAFEDAIAAHPAEPLAEQPRGSAMLYSSGTTGRPKGIKRPLDGTSITDPDLVGVGLVGGIFGIGEGSMYLSPAPLYHSAPLSFTTGTQSMGGTAVVMDRFDAAEALSYIERYRITHSQWVPTMFSRMLKLPETERTRHDLFQPPGRRACGGTVPRRGEATDDRLVGPDPARVLRRHRTERLLLRELRRVAPAPRNGRQAADRRHPHLRRRGQRAASRRGGHDLLRARGPGVRIPQRPRQDRRFPSRRP